MAPDSAAFWRCAARRRYRCADRRAQHALRIPTMVPTRDFPVSQTTPGGAGRGARRALAVEPGGGGRCARIRAHSGGIPEFGNAPLIRWSDEVADQEEHIVTTVLRDALLAAFHRGLGRTMPDEADCVILNWVPDPTTLLHIPGSEALPSNCGCSIPAGD